MHWGGNPALSSHHRCGQSCLQTQRSITQDEASGPHQNQTATNVKQVPGLIAVLIFAAATVLPARCFAAPAAQATTADWVAPMKQVHARFAGTRGTFAQFGDSISVTMAFWAPLKWEVSQLHQSAEQET